MRDKDYNGTIAFLSQFFEFTSGEVELRAIANDGGMLGRVFTRNPDDVIAFCQRRDVPGVAVYFGPCTRIANSRQGRREDLAESIAAWVDIDVYKLGITVEDAVAALRGSPFPPTVIVLSGGGVHAYWLWREPIALPEEADRLEAVLQQLAGVFCGDPLPAQVAAVMRLPGSHNSKSRISPDGSTATEMVECVVLEGTWTRWELSELEEELFQCRPLISAPASTAGPSASKSTMASETDPFVAFAKSYGFKAPLDVERALADMTYGGGECGIHNTQLKVSGSLANTPDISDEAIVDILMRRTQQVAPPGNHWNWAREEKGLRDMIEGIRKRRRAEGKDPYPQRVAPEPESMPQPADPKIVQLRPRGQEAPSEPEIDQPTRVAAAAVFGDHPLNDLGNVIRMVLRHGPKIRYCIGIGWHVWDGRRFRFDPENIRTIRLAQDTVKAMLLSAFGSVAEKKIKERLIKFAIECGNTKRLNPMVQLARAQDTVTVVADDLDRDLMLLNCLNGTVDLRTGALRPHDQSDILTKMSGTAYDPDAACPQWEKFVSEIFDGKQDLIGFVQRALGYSLCGDTREEVVFILHGSGANGKTVLVETVAAVMGDYVKRSAADTWTTSSKATDRPTYDLAALVGARFVPVVETERGQQLAEARIKQATGRDRISARAMYKDPFDYMPQFKLWLATNHKPKIRGSDHAIWRRIYLIPFLVRFVDREKVDDEGGRHVKDPELINKLKAERAGILAWMVRGCLEWQRLNSLNPPADVLTATQDYQEGEDNISAFIEDCCNVRRSFSEAFGLLYAAYLNWCDANEEGEPQNRTAFGLNLTERGHQLDRKTKDRIRKGLSLKSNFIEEAKKRRDAELKKTKENKEADEADPSKVDKSQSEQ